MSNKVYTFNICNNTKFVLYRNNHKIRHGNWITWLPEKILPLSSISISFTNSRSGHSCRSYLQYGVILDELLHVLEIKFVKSSENHDFSCTFKPFEKHSDVLNNNSFKIVNNVPTKICTIQTHVIDPNKANFIDSSETIYILNVEETTEGSSYVQSLINKFNSDLSQIKNKYDNWSDVFFVGPELVNLHKIIPVDFSWDFNKSDWPSSLKKSNVSVLVRIVNLTSKDMKLGSNGSEMYNNCVLDEGVWVEYPNEEIKRLCGTEFGCKSSGFLGGTTGSCVYSILGESGTFTFSWDRPSIGAFTAKCKHSLNKYSVMVHTDSSNHSVAIFHIIDVLKTPIKILTARAISPKLFAKYQGTKLSTRYTKHLNSTDNKSSDNNIDDLLITQFIEKYKSSEDNNNSNSEDTDEEMKELLIKSPRHFFSSVNSNNINSPINKVSLYSSIYLEWMIGNEIFCKLFKFDEKIHLNSSFVSGISDNKSLLFNSYLLRLDLTHVFKKIAVTNRSNHFVNDQINELKRPYLKTVKQNELLDYVLMIFQCVCDAFQPCINTRMTKKFGQNWLKTCKLPTCHIWKNHDVLRIDVEGIVYIVTAYWMEVFEQILVETTQLNILQTAAIYWANQELQRFDSNYVWELLEASKVLLKKLKAESSLKHIEFISNKFVQS